MTPIKGMRCGALAGSDLERRINADQVLMQYENRPGWIFPEIQWSQYCIAPESELAVTARCGAVAIYAHAPYLFFGVVFLDEQFGQELVNALEEAYGPELVAAALNVRAAESTRSSGTQSNPERDL